MNTRIPRRRPPWTSIVLLLLLAAGHCRAEPAVVRDGPRATLNLDGTWDVLPAAGVELKYPPVAQGWKPEAVPQPASPSINTVGGPYMPALSDLIKKDGGGFVQSEKMAAWFRRRFRVAPPDLAGKRAILVFHGAAFRSTAWLNGKELGTSYQCAVPFEYDVTAAIRPGENELLVGLTGREGITDIANRCFVTPCNGMMAGIWGSVELQLRPPVTLDDVFVRTSVKNRRLELELAVRNTGAADAPPGRGRRRREGHAAVLSGGHAAGGTRREERAGHPGRELDRPEALVAGDAGALLRAGQPPQG